MRASEFKAFWEDNFLKFRQVANGVAREACDLARDREAAVNDGMAEAYFALRAKDDRWWAETQNPLARSKVVVRLATQVAARAIRRQSREIAPRESIESNDHHDVIQEYVEREGWRQAVSRCVGRLPPDLRDVLLLYAELDNLRDAAQANDAMDKETFRRRLVRAQGTMRECLERSMNE